MKNTLIHDGTTQLLLANVNDGTNRLFINEVEIPSSSWVGDGTYTQVINGVTISIVKIADLNINVMLQKISNTTYRLVGKESEPKIQFSHIGQIIYSTTLDTLEKVQAIYGSDTTWIEHSGYFLRGASSGVSSNHIGNDGGTDNINLSHSHTVNKHSHYYGISFAVQHGAMLGETTTAGGLHKNGNANTLQHFYNTGGNASALRPNALTSSQVESGRAVWASNTTTSESSPATNAQLSNAQSIIPSYKNVYIWERTA